MVYKIISLIVSAMLIQTIAGQYLRNGYTPGYGNELSANLAVDNLVYSQAYGPAIASALTDTPAAELAYESAFAAARTGLNYGLSIAELGASNGGGLRVQSSSSIPPSGVTVESDNMLIEGPLTVSGQLPFLGVVALEGPLSVAGAGSVAFGCGNGNVGIVSEGVETLAPVYPNTLTSAYPNAMAPGYPNAMAPVYPNAMAPGYPNAMAPGYPNAMAPGYPNALAPGYPNAMAPGYPNAMAPGYPNAIPAFGLGSY